MKHVLCGSGCGWSAQGASSEVSIRLLRAIVAVQLGISFYRIDLKALDRAYSEAFPQSTPINKSKKGEG